jgi:hypothetical protein
VKLWATIVLAGALQYAHSAITYVDATPANTTLQGGAALVLGANCTSGSDAGAMDGLWHLKSGVGNGGNGIWTADEGTNGIEDVVSLVTTIHFPEAGGFRVFAYIWDSEEPGHDWDATVRLGSAAGSSKVQASEAGPAEAAHFSSAVVTTEGMRRLIQIPLGTVVVSSGGTVQVSIDDDTTIGSRATWYDGVGYERAFGGLGERVIAIDCNKTNAPAAPSQALFRSLGGSSTTSQNSTNMTKAVGPYTLQFSKTSTTRFDFRGANGDATRAIPGGPTSLSFLVADFLGSRDGTINIAISNLSAGTYLFRSYHLDTFNSGNLGFAQGTSPTNQNTLRAHIGGVLMGIVQPAALGSSGLGTNFISDAHIPILAFPFTASGAPVNIQLSTVYANGADRFILLNGFEVFSTTP